MHQESQSLEYHTWYFNHIQWLSRSLTLCVIIPALGFYNTPWHDYDPCIFSLGLKLMHCAYGVIYCNGSAARLCHVMSLNQFWRISFSPSLQFVSSHSKLKSQAVVLLKFFTWTVIKMKTWCDRGKSWLITPPALQSLFSTPCFGFTTYLRMEK